MLGGLAILFIGFSLFSALALALTHFQGDQYRDQPVARLAGLVLLLALALLQAAHFADLQFDRDWTGSAWYRATLFIVAPAFLLFSRPILEPQSDRPAAWTVALHAVPALLAGALSPSLAMPLAFAIGAGYLGWLARKLFALRGERASFHLELVLLGVVFGLALGVVILGVWGGAVPRRLFLELYASAIGLAFFLVLVTLGLRPQLSAQVQETAQAAYAHSTLAKVDCDAALARLDRAVASGEAALDQRLRETAAQTAKGDAAVREAIAELDGLIASLTGERHG